MLNLLDELKVKEDEVIRNFLAKLYQILKETQVNSAEDELENRGC